MSYLVVSGPAFENNARASRRAPSPSPSVDATSSKERGGLVFGRRWMRSLGSKERRRRYGIRDAAWWRDRYSSEQERISAVKKQGKSGSTPHAVTMKSGAVCCRIALCEAWASLSTCRGRMGAIRCKRQLAKAIWCRGAHSQEKQGIVKSGDALRRKGTNCSMEAKSAATPVLRCSSCKPANADGQTYRNAADLSLRYRRSH